MARRGPSLGSCRALVGQALGGGGTDTRSTARDQDHLVLKTFGPLSYLSMKFVLGACCQAVYPFWRRGVWPC
jgi:hypothetical protein